MDFFYLSGILLHLTYLILYISFRRLKTFFVLQMTRSSVCFTQISSDLKVCMKQTRKNKNGLTLMISYLYGIGYLSGMTIYSQPTQLCFLQVKSNMASSYTLILE